MKKNGFTLVEVVSVIILLSVLMLLIVPTVSDQIKKGKQKTYDAQIENIKIGLESWEKDNIYLKNGESVKLTLSQLKYYGYIEKDLINPKTNEILSYDTELKITKNNNVSKYEVELIGNNKNKYDSLNTILLKGNIKDYLEVKTNYIDPGVEAKDTNGNNVLVTEENNINNQVLGTYYKKYTAQNNSFYRTIIVRDTTSPIITIKSNLTTQMTYNTAKTFDFTTDITVKDNYDNNIKIKATNNIKPTAGTYTIEYKAIDSSNNETVKTRNIEITG